MNIIAALIPFALAIASEATEASKGYGHQHQHHQYGCGSCSREEAEKVAMARQVQLQVLAQNCDYEGALQLSVPGAGFATTDSYCLDGSCCSDVGTMENWWTYYQCYDTLIYPAVQSIQHLANGTIIITRPELQDTLVNEGAGLVKSLFAYNNSYHWYPVKPAHGQGCDFRLGFIKANSLNCPVFIPNAVSCLAPECVGN